MQQINNYGKEEVCVALFLEPVDLNNLDRNA